MNTNKNTIDKHAIYDARQLGKPKTLILGFQHMFAMFGSTVLVPALTGLSVSATLLFAGLGTLLFHFLSKGKIPAFLGSSFAFLAGYMSIAPNGERELLPYACLGVACAGLVYLVLAALIKSFGSKRILKFFPPIVTGPIIIAIGLTLSGSAIGNCKSNIWISGFAILIVILCNIWGKGIIKIIPILLSVIGSSTLAAVFYITKIDVSVINVDKLEAFQNASWIGFPLTMQDTVFSIFSDLDATLLITSIVTIVPISIATIMEHIGDISAISSTVGKNFFKDPGLHRTLLGDGLATIIASLFGAPANTTYGENTGVLSLSKVFDPFVVRLAAYLAILFSFSPKFAALISLMPMATIGGVSLILYGMISAVGLRNIVESNVDFSNSRNIIIAALILVIAIGVNYGTVDGSFTFIVGSISIGLSGLALGSLIGIILNAIMPNNDYNPNQNTD